MTSTHHKKLLHTEIVPIRWGDMDAVGHVNNTIFFRYIEQARIGWFNSLGVLEPVNGVGPSLISTSCTFFKQLAYPGNVEVKTYCSEIGRSSVTTIIEMRPSYDPEVVYAEGTAKIVWVDYTKGKSVPLPNEIRNSAAD
ncbi:MAG: acyl-CoA thioesterase [Betaproteobacteria bacterium]|nr:acyl-CoA thioesterase [Betaproteobacteria bacterium]